MRENGHLILFWHGEEDKNRTKFHCEKYPYFFTELEAFSKEWGEKIYSVYLNITKPFDVVDKSEYDLIMNEFLPYAEQHNIEVLGLDELKIGKYTPFPLVDTLYYYLRDNTEYDGILAEEFSEQSNYFKKWGKKGQISYIPFYSNQIKLSLNKHPTTNDNIDN